MVTISSVYLDYVKCILTSVISMIIVFFLQMENIGNFLDACENYGVNKLDLFQTVYLFEGTNMPQVRI